MAVSGGTPDRAIAPLLEESLDDLYEHAPCGYISALADGTIVKVNQTFLEWTGYAREELLGVRRFQDLLTPGGQIYHETHYSPLLQMQGSVREIALQMRRADGSRLPVLVNSVLRTAPEDGRTVVRTTVFDATDRKAYEQELLVARRRESEARERTVRLQKLTELLAATLDEREVAAAAVDAAMKAVGADAGRLECVDLDGERVEALCSRGGVPTTASEEVELSGASGPLGRLQLLFAEPREISDADRDFLLACARQCGQALERARLHAQTLRSGWRATFLAELSRELGETRDYGERAQRLVELLVPSVADEASVDVLDERGRRDTVAHAGATAGEDPGGSLTLELRGRGAEVGSLVLRRRIQFSRSERGFLGDVADRAALALENARLYEHEHRVANALQRSMLTRDLPEDPRFLVSAHYQPAVEAMEVGGDWYDAFTAGDGRLAVVVGDVVGRGIEAASAMGQLRSAVRALAVAAEGPAQILQRLDEFVEHIDIARNATIAYADLDLETGVLRYACAGHPPPVLIGGDGTPRLLWEGRSPPVGAFAGAFVRDQAEAVLEPGARLLLYTDGLVERRDRPIDRGLDELLAAVTALPGAPLPSLVGRLPGVLVAAHAGRDDVCLLGLSFGSPPVFERAVHADVSELAPLRADLRAWLAGHRLAEDDCSAVVLACSEAVANAIEHGCGGDTSCDVRIRAMADEREVSIAVRDDGTWRPPDAPGRRGRGLMLIDHFMSEVAIDHGDGTEVRMRLARQGGAGA